MSMLQSHLLSRASHLMQPGAIREEVCDIVCIANSYSFIKKLLYMIHPGYLLHCEPKRVCHRCKVKT